MKQKQKQKPILGVLVRDSMIDYFLNYKNTIFKTEENCNIKDINKLCEEKYNCDVYTYRLLYPTEPVLNVKFISQFRTVEFKCSVFNKQLKWNWFKMQHDWEYQLTKVD